MNHHCFCNEVEACRTKQDLARLTTVWDRTFLNYTAEFPDRWHDPEDEYPEDLQLPEYAIPFLKKSAELDHSVNASDRIRAYWEFFAAVWRIRFDRKQLEIALPFLKTTALRQKNIPYFKLLLDAVESELFNAPAASADPHKHTQYLSKD